MSLYYVQKLLYQLNRDKYVRRRYEENFGSLYQQFAITVAVSVVFSSINALTLSPALCSLLLRKQEPSKGLLGRFFTKFNEAFDRLTDKYVILTRLVAPPDPQPQRSYSLWNFRFFRTA